MNNGNCINCKQESYAVKKRDVNKIYSMIMEHKDSEYSLITRQILCKAAFDTAKASNIKIRLSEDVSDEKSVKQHIWTLIKAGFPPAAAVEVIQLLLKGKYKEAFMQMPGVNLWHTPGALWGLLEKGVSALPEDLRSDILANDEVKYLVNLILSLKDAGTSEDLNEFYNNLKEVIVASKPALIALAVIFTAIAGFCAATAVGATAAIMAVGFAIVSIPVLGWLAVPLFYAVLLVDSVCAVVGSASGVAAILNALGAGAISYSDTEQIDEELKRQVLEWVNSVEGAHTQKAEEIAQQVEAAAAEEPAEVPTEPPLRRAAESQVRGDIISESLKTRWQVIAGIKEGRGTKS